MKDAWTGLTILEDVVMFKLSNSLEIRFEGMPEVKISGGETVN